MLIAVGSYWAVGMPIAYTLAFPLGWQGIGVWWGLAAGLASPLLDDRPLSPARAERPGHGLIALASPR